VSCGADIVTPALEAEESVVEEVDDMQLPIATWNKSNCSNRFVSKQQGKLSHMVFVSLNQNQKYSISIMPECFEAMHALSAPIGFGDEQLLLAKIWNRF
jgi:hypothetical protein